MRSPITTERQNIQLLRESGFTQQQAEAVATVVENSQQSGFEKFSEVLARELGAIRTELREAVNSLRAELKIEIRDSRIDIQKSINEQIWKILAIVLGVATVAVAIIKVAPNWHG
jgi:biotin operon repressor